MKVGSLVLCIANHIISGSNLSLLNDGYVFPQKGIIYTVRGFNDIKTGILLEEIINPKVKLINGKILEVAFDITAFKEIQPPINIESIVAECLTIELI